MEQILLFGLLGLGAGALYAGLALGIVLTYRGSGTINIAVGAVAMVGAYWFYGLKTGGYLWLPVFPGLPRQISLGGPWPAAPAFLVSIGLCAVLGVVFDLLVLRRLRQAPALAKLVATLGLLLLLQNVILQRFGVSGQAAPEILPQNVVHMLGSIVPIDRFILAGIVIAATAVVALLYRRTRFGLAARAASEREEEALLVGLSPSRIALVSTVATFVLAGALGILVAPLTQLDPATLALAVIPALGAALLARFTSFPTAVGVGLLLGVVGSVLVYLQTKPWFPTADGSPLPGVTDLLWFLVIIVALVWRGSSLPRRGALIAERLPRSPRPERLLRPAALWVIACVLALLFLSYGMRQAVILSLIGVVTCLPLVVLVGYVGQLSLAQMALSGVAGFTISRMAIHAGIGFPLGPLIGIAVAVAFGMLAAVPALRIRGISLAIVTLAAAVAVEGFVFENPVWGGGSGGSPVPQPHLFGLSLGTEASFPTGGDGVPSPVFGFVCLAAAVPLTLLVGSLRRSHLGRRMLAVRSDEAAAAAAGISVRNVKLAAFAIASFLAGVAGALYAYNFGSVSADRFGLIVALSFIAFAYIGGVGTVVGAVIVGIAATEGIGPHLVNQVIPMSPTTQLVVGALALMVVLVQAPDGIAGALEKGPPPPFNLLAPLFRRLSRGTALKSASGGNADA